MKLIKYLRLALSYIFVFPIKIYQWFISPILPNSCRYSPTCSHYSISALKTHGLIKGLFLATRRIFSCNPWGGSGYDPVPDKNNFTWRKPQAQKRKKVKY